MALFQPPGDCPVCGSPVPRGARSCPECGACDKAGWDDEESHLDGVELPGEDDGDREEPELRPFFDARIAVALVLLVILTLVWLLVAYDLPPVDRAA